MTPETDADEEHDDIIYPSAIPFILVHLGCFAAIWTGVTWQALAICVTLYWLRIFAIGAGYHRYFSHRSYSTSRAFQFVLAFMSQTTHSWPAFMRRRTMLAPMRPRPIIPSCIGPSRDWSGILITRPRSRTNPFAVERVI